MIDGLVIVDKPAGMTSHDVVGRCRRIFDQRRVGHAGTLDPDATGLLLVGLGRATRLLRWVTGLTKSYAGEIVCGVATTTLDESGEVTGRWDLTSVTIEDARVVAATLTGDIDQVPPMVSAVKVGGRRLHQLARQGVEVDRPPRRVHVSRFDLDLAGDEPAGPHAARGPVLAASVECTSGTYVRVLAADLGAGLGGGAYLRNLRRTAVGTWTEADATPLDDLGPAAVRPPVAAVVGLDHVTATPDVAGAVSHGRSLTLTALGAAGPGPWAVIGATGDLLAVYEAADAARARAVTVLLPGDR